ncbi:molecular chaperone [Stenotrophomonas maltophilia]|uniref:fimbrial biogenesis chaperone n=1 Tax=Stenotrophomonas maltophilia TaxID=40324 RepID=UPI0039C3BD4B
MNNPMRYVLAGMLAVAGTVAGRAEAGVVIGGTRVVYPSQEKEVTVKFTNEGGKPSLVQVWLDDGDESSTPDTAKVPFTVAPPVFRLDPGKGQAVRVMHTGETLSADRETLFWLNLLDVPPKADNAEGRNLLQFAFRTRIKVFYRPSGLAGDVNTAPDKLVWALTQTGGKVALQATNPTPYHVNFAHVGLNVGGKSLGRQSGGMVAPMSTATFVQDGVGTRPSGDVKAEITVINDFGALIETLKPLSP